MAEWWNNSISRNDYFFDWDHDGNSDHVGIVEKCEGGRVYTVEGNSSDQVRQRNYAVDYASIMGYGVIN